tara:strand:+ start:467 stop:1096 length:630 start_codon:yes stop_codon:yes gene_type:complete
MSIIMIISSLLVGYLFGCFQTSYFISRLVLKKDIRNLGSGNAGASNVTSELGWKYGIITGLLDLLKAYIPTQFIIYIYPNTQFPIELMVLAGTGSFLGHIYPFFLNFRGGKGVACYIGMLLAIDPIIGIFAIFGIIFLTFITDYVTIGSLALFIVIPIITYLCGKYSNLVIMCTCIILVIGLIKHWINIKRIYKGEEVGLKSVLNKRNN